MGKSAASDINLHLENKLFGTRGTDIFTNFIPDSPDNLIATFDVPGPPPPHSMGGTSVNPALEIHGIQINVRNVSAEQAQSKMYDIFKELDGTGGVTLNAREYLYIEAVQTPFLLDRDEKERVTFTCNFLVTRRSA